jgi:hypothetical protein
MGTFLEPAGYKKKDAFKFAKRAYDVRSGVAHGGELPKNIRISGRSDEVLIHDFVQELTGLVRASLKRAVGLYASTSDFATTEYWENLLFKNLDGRQSQKFLRVTAD